MELRNVCHHIIISYLSFSIETEEHYKATLEKIPDYGIEDEDVKICSIDINVHIIIEIF